MNRTAASVLNWSLVWDGSRYTAQPYPLAGAPETLDGVSLLLPAGAYTTFRTYRHTCAIRFQDHLERLRDSAERAQTMVNLHLPELRQALRVVVAENPFQEARVRISLDLTDSPGRMVVSLEELHLLPAQAYETGVKTICRSMHRDNPQAKLTNFIATAAAYRAQLPPGVNEMLMVSPEGVVLEGLSSNFFGIYAGVLHTAEAGVLWGITRAVVLDLAQRQGLSVDLRGIRYLDCAQLDECFISSASRGVLPVSQIDACRIGTGRPGALTRSLMGGFEAWVKSEAEEI